MATFARGHWTRKSVSTNAKFTRELNREVQTTAGRVTWIVNPTDLRGIPAIGRSVRGAISGTDPETEATR